MKRWVLHLPAGARSAWVLVAIWTVATYSVVPLARAMQRWLREVGGEDAATTGVLAVGAVVCGWLLVRLLRPSVQRRRVRLGILAALAAVGYWVMATQLETASEAVHFVQYALLAVLLVHALSFSMNDGYIYPAAFLASLILAMGDEFLQWMAPGRYWDYRDIALNGFAAALALLAIRFVMQPPGRWRPVAPSSVRRVARLGTVFFLLLGLSFSVTPRRVDRLAEYIPGLGFLSGNASVINELGYRHTLSDGTVFFSRLTREALREADASRAEEIAGVLAGYPEEADYARFLSDHPSGRDPFLHEFRVHIYRRNHYAETMWKHEADPERHRWHATVADREQAILEAVFPNTLAASAYAWPETTVRYFRERADPDPAYRSEVSDHLQTELSEGQQWLAVLAAWAVFLAATRLYARRLNAAAQSLSGVAPS